MGYDTLNGADAHSIGVDISKAILDVHAYPIGQANSFANTTGGLNALLKWLTTFEVTRVMCEPTGAFHYDVERVL